jgi:glucokinase
MLLGGDIGGTKTLLGLFEPGEPRPRPLHVDEFITLDHDGLESILGAFLQKYGVSASELDASSFGVAGAITDQVAQLTNVPWRIDAGEMMRHRFRRVRLLNDLEALAYAIPVLTPDELAVLQEGVRISSGNVAVIAAGTGLGEGMLLNIGGRLVPGQSEGGHADFAARTPRELDMVAALTRVFGRVSAEHILSGPGLVNVYRFTHGLSKIDAALVGERLGAPAVIGVRGTCAAVGHVSDPADLPPRITASALAGKCPDCVEALDLFVSAYGAEAGNMGLRVVATAGVYIGGGIAPRILPALRNGRFMDAFRAKAPLAELVSRMPVAVILNSKSGLLGAAVHANQSQ